MIKAFLKKRWLFLVLFLVAFVLLTLFLLIITSQPQEGGFVYQIN